MTAVNEFLQQLEVFPGVVACTTNLFDKLDQASLRRFVFKIEFEFLRPEQSAAGVPRAMADLGCAGEIPSSVEVALAPHPQPDARRLRRGQAPVDGPGPTNFGREHLLAELRPRFG